MSHLSFGNISWSNTTYLFLNSYLYTIVKLLLLKLYYSLLSFYFLYFLCFLAIITSFFLFLLRIVYIIINLIFITFSYLLLNNQRFFINLRVINTYCVWLIIIWFMVLLAGLLIIVCIDICVIALFELLIGVFMVLLYFWSWHLFWLLWLRIKESKVGLLAYFLLEFHRF
jgi:hypothetical protein